MMGESNRARAFTRVVEAVAQMYGRDAAVWFFVHGRHIISSEGGGLKCKSEVR